MKPAEKAILMALSPDAKFTITGSKQLTAAVVSVQGHKDLRRALAGLISAFEFVRRELMDLLVDEDRCAYHSRVTIRFVPRDKTVTTDILDLFKFDKGRLPNLRSSWIRRWSTI